MNTDNAFFAAYGQPVTFDGGRDKAPKSRRGAPAKGHSHHATSIDSQYTDVAWYRVDQGHFDADGVPAPHAPRGKSQVAEPAPAVSSPPPASLESASASAWLSLDQWQSSCVVMATPMSAPLGQGIAEPPAPAETIATVVEKKQEATKGTPTAVAAEPEAAPSVSAAAKAEPPSAESVPSPVAASESTPSRPWMPQWEVDEFAWPEELLRLQDRQVEYFRYAGEKLRDACREGLKTMAVVSTREKEGSTTMAICLARAAAAAGARVALLDANLHHPELGPKLGLEFSHGWQESLDEPTTLAEAAVVALDSGLTLLPLSAAHRIGALSDPRVTRLIAEINKAFDLLIIDAGIAGDGEETWFADSQPRVVNAALVVRDLRRTSETETLVTASRLKLFGVDAVGIAENFVTAATNQSAAA